MSLRDRLDQDEKKYSVGGSGDTFKFQKGQNRIRLLSEWATLGQHFLGRGVKPAVCRGEDEGCPYHGEGAPLDSEGKPTKVRPRFVLYVLDRADNRVKLAFLPYAIIKLVVELSENPEWEWDDWPMPYDLTITFDKDKGPNDMYHVVASPKREEVPAEVITELGDKMTPEEIVERMREKQVYPDTDE